MTVLGGARPLPGAVRFPESARRAAGRPAGARPSPPVRPGAVPAGRVGVGAVPRRRLSSPSRAGNRRNPVAILMAVVLVVFLVSLVYLAQAVQLAATNLSIDQLVSQRDDLHRQVQNLETNVLTWGAEANVLAQAQRSGLDQLGPGVRLPAR